MRYFGDKLKPRTVSYETALALLEDGEARLTQLRALAADHPEFGPLAWLISQEFSETRRGDQTLADQRAEKEWLEKFSLTTCFIPAFMPISSFAVLHSFTAF